MPGVFVCLGFGFCGFCGHIRCRGCCRWRAVYDCVVRSLRFHPRIDPVPKPAEGAKDREPDQKAKPKQKQKPDQKIAAFGSSYSWIAGIRGKLVDLQGAIASRLTPTIGSSTSTRKRSVVRPPSRAGSLPQKSKSKVKRSQPPAAPTQ